MTRRARSIGVRGSTLAGNVIVYVYIYLSVITASVAEPPTNANPALATWFRGLKAPNGTACCTIADCRRADYRLTPDGYQAMIEGRWVSVPWERVLRRIDNPTGEAVVCYVPHTELIMCFVRPPEM